MGIKVSFGFPAAKLDFIGCEANQARRRPINCRQDKDQGQELKDRQNS